MTNSSTSAPLVGATLDGRYEVVRLIARGGMGDVYEARDALLRRAVAVKVYRASVLADRSRFDAEVHTLAALNHPGLVQVYDVGEHDDDEFVVLELVDGPTLAAVFAQRGPMPSAEVAALGSAVAAALAYVHDAGVVHRDVTPSNILCGTDGRPRLADFGIARLLDATRLTAVATTIGTAAYMAPEQVEGRDVTTSADVYALGLVLLQGLTGRQAFAGVGHEVALARLARDPDVATDVPVDWQPLLREMTQRAPEARVTAAAVSDRIDGLTRGTATTSAVAPRAAVGAASFAQTEAMRAVEPVAAVHGHTAVMPVASAASYAMSDQFVARVARVVARRPWLWGALMVALLVIIAALVSDGSDGLDVPTSTTEVVVTVPPATTPTTVPPTTPPPKTGKGKGHDD